MLGIAPRGANSVYCNVVPCASAYGVNEEF